MGYQHGRLCLGSYAEWEDSVYSGMPLHYQAASSATELYFSKSTGVWRMCRNTISSTGARSGNVCVAPVHAKPDVKVCSEAAAVGDGAAVGFLLLGVLVLAWGYVKLRGQLR